MPSWNLVGLVSLLAPHEQTAIGPTGREGIERDLVRTFVVELGTCLLLRSPYGHRIAIDDPYRQQIDAVFGLIGMQGRLDLTVADGDLRRETGRRQ